MRIHSNNSQLAEAISICSSKLLTDPCDLLTLLIRGVLRDMNKEFHPALEDFKRASELQPENKNISYLIAYTLLHMGESKEAVRTFWSASGINTNLAGIQNSWVIPQIIRQRARVVSHIELRLQNLNLNDKYGFRMNLNMS